MQKLMALRDAKQKSVINPVNVISVVRKNMSRARMVYNDPKMNGYLVLNLGKEQMYAGLLGTKMSEPGKKEMVAFSQIAALGDLNYLLDNFYGIIRSMNAEIPLTISICSNLHETRRFIDFFVVLTTAVELGLIRPEHARAMCEKLECEDGYLNFIRMSCE
jgi:hypothetical protein